ncbi:MAG: diguanylate cyclase [Candidatus Brocadiales bacterium]|nr:diguanylate cyclase [Candidatus Brocadiales bacterium]
MNREKPNVLVVDDEETILKSLSLTLQEGGYDVTVAKTGSEGLEKLGKNRYDAIIVDYKLPDIDGLEIAKAIRDRDRKVSLIIITAYIPAETADISIRLGNYNFLEKPLEGETVLSTLKRSLISRDYLANEQQILDRPNILVVDDDYEIRSGLEEILKAAGYNYKSCANGHEALEKIKEELFHMLIVDLNLGDMEGVEVIKKAKEHFPEMMIILITGSPSVESVVVALKSGTFDYIIKPLHLEDVLGRIKIGWEKYKQAVLVKQLLQNLRITTLELEKFNKQLSTLAVTDYLTSLYNHRYIMEALSREYSKIERFHRSLAVLLLDLDHFKSVNDRYGHQAGDAVLMELGSLLKNSVRTMDIVGRYGGEEFCIILSETDSEKAVVIGERILQTIAKKLFKIKEDLCINITASLGVCGTDVKGVHSIGILLDCADKALYEAKARGRNRVVCWKEIGRMSSIGHREEEESRH